MAPLVKLAQQGYDVNTAGDENLIFSSEWPLFKIYRAASFSISDVTQPQVIATHDLGFPPVFWYFTNTDISAWNGFGAQQPAERSEFFGSVGGGSISVSNSQLVYNPPDPFSLSSGSVTGYYYIMANDLTQPYTAPINNVGGLPAGKSPGRAFKIAKSGQNVKSHRLKDFVIHSDTRSPLIQSINPGIVSLDPSFTSSFGFTVFHGLNYVPMFMAYTYSKGFYTYLYTGSGGGTLLTADPETVKFTEAAGGRNLTIVILKDPFLVSYTVSVDV